MTAPFLKWAGGKRRMLPTLLPLFPTTIRDYVEPFLGGGAVMLALLGAGRIDRHAFGSDVNEHLIETWQAVHECSELLISEVRRLVDRHAEDPATAYYAVRDAWNRGERDAARFYYLNRASFNGLWRENRSGGMNVPLGDTEATALLDEGAIRAASRALHSRAVIQHCHWNDRIVNEGDTVYLDPPYDDPRGQFTGFHKSGFGPDDQADLAAVATDWVKAVGARVIASNADTPLVRQLYSDPVWRITAIEAPRTIGRRGKTAAKVGEVIICGGYDP